MNEDDKKGLLAKMFGGWNRLRENPVADVALGFTPAGVAADVQDASSAIRNRDLVGLGLAGVGFIPGVGDVVKGVGKGLRRGVSNLPMDEASRLARAREMGFDVDRPMYHGTSYSFPEFQVSEAGMMGPGVYVTNLPSEADYYAKKSAEFRNFAEGRPDVGANVVPVVVREGNLFDLDARDMWKAFGDPDSQEELVRRAREAGYIGARGSSPYSGSGQKAEGIVEYISMFDPKDVRSRFAAFDPAMRESANLLAGTAGAMIGGSAVARALKEENKREER